MSHIYNLRKAAAHGKPRVRVQHTRARRIAIGERRKPNPKGQPGYIRVDTVHQGHKDGKPGVYQINAVDAVTQREAIGVGSSASSAISRSNVFGLKKVKRARRI